MECSFYKEFVMKTIFLTGATGALGMRLLWTLLELGYVVYALVRDKAGIKAVERIPPRNNLPGKLFILQGDIDNENLIDDPDLATLLRGEVDFVIHSAASVKFDEANREQIYKTNLYGLINVLNFAKKIKTKQLVHVSTVYVAGDMAFLDESPLKLLPQARNPYEESKAKGETIVEDWSISNGIPATIVRPSIIVGADDTGEISGFEGYYGFFKNTARNVKRGYLPVRIRCSNESTINLVPVDWVTKIIASLLEIEPAHRVYNLVNPVPPLVRWVIDTTLKKLGFFGYAFNDEPLIAQAVQTVGESEKGVLRTQKILDRGLRRYEPYVQKEAVFLFLNAELALKEKYIPPPIINEETISRLIDFAEKSKWGSKELKSTTGSRVHEAA